MSGFLAFLIIFYNVIISLLFLILKNKNLLLLKYNLDVKFYIPVIGLLSGLILFVTNPGAIDVAKNRGMENINITFDILKEFFNLYFQKCFKEEIIYWLIFIVLMCFAFYFAYKKGDLRKVIFPLLMQISVLTVIFSLVLCGKTYENLFYLEHANIIFLYKMLILYPLLIFFGYYISCAADKIKLRYFCLIIVISIFYMFQIIKIIPDSNINEFFKYKKISYMTEKIFRFYTFKGEIPVIPDCSDDTFFIYPYFININEGDELVSYFYDKDYLENPGEPLLNRNVNWYYSKVYNDKEEHKYKITKNALELFYKKGGTFSDEELKNIRFSRLFDKKFVLNERQ